MAQVNKKRKGSTQYNARSREDKSFLEKQWWLGFKAGINLTGAEVENSYSAISAVDYTAGKKEYTNYQDPGIQVALEVTFYYKGLSASVQPTYRNSKFSYTTETVWEDSSNPANYLELNYLQDQQLDYLDFPLVIRYDLTGTQLRPYLQAGAYYSILLNANKSVTISGIDLASGGTNAFTNPPIRVGAEDLFAGYHWGLLAGAGVNYHVGNIRLNLDVSYRMGMSLANSTENRYSNELLTGVGDVMDDFSLNAISVTVGCLFPMRYLSSGFKSLDN
jgi:hypothetical protein